jgi:hypothetical protein
MTTKEMLRFKSLLGSLVPPTRLSIAVAILASLGAYLLCEVAAISIILGAAAGKKLFDLLLKSMFDELINSKRTDVDNIYITSQTPNDDSVLIRSRLWREVLEIANNHSGVQVILIVFRLGADCNETWEEYESRRYNIIYADRQTRHHYLHKADEDRYFTHVLKQQAI